MKVFEIKDNGLNISVGVLICYERTGKCVIELEDGLDEWNAPLLFSGLVKKGIYTVPQELSLMWVRERVIPSGRQNIGNILKNHKLKTYDEFKLIEISKGRCSQDNLSIEKLSELPQYVKTRQQHNLIDVITCEGYRLLCFFTDGTAGLIELSQMSSYKDVDKVLKNKQLYETGKISVGGYSVTFNDSIDIPSKLLYEKSAKLPVNLGDFESFAKKNLLDTSMCCELLGCSRQNLAYLVKQEQLRKVKEDVKGNLYLKGEVLSEKD